MERHALIDGGPPRALSRPGSRDLSPSVCDSVIPGDYEGTEMQSLSLALTVTAHLAMGSPAHLFLLVLLFALKTETTFLGRLEPPGSIYQMASSSELNLSMLP